MNDNIDELLRRLAVSSVEACLARLTGVSAGTWSVASAGVRPGTLEDALKRRRLESREAAAVYFRVSGEFPFVSLILFDPDEIGAISRCFLGYAFPGIPGIKLSEEIMLLELGNIVLNSVVGVVSNRLGKILMPAVPRYALGGTERLAAELGAVLDPGESFRIITLELEVRSGGSASGISVLCLIPGKLAGELERGAL